MESKCWCCPGLQLLDSLQKISAYIAKTFRSLLYLFSLFLSYVIPFPWYRNKSPLIAGALPKVGFAFPSHMWWRKGFSGEQIRHLARWDLLRNSTWHHPGSICADQPRHPFIILLAQEPPTCSLPFKSAGCSGPISHHCNWKSPLFWCDVSFCPSSCERLFVTPVSINISGIRKYPLLENPPSFCKRAEKWLTSLKRHLDGYFGRRTPAVFIKRGWQGAKNSNNLVRTVTGFLLIMLS